MTDPNSSFVHPALPVGVDAIRVLRLEPGDYLSPLVGKLTSVAFSEKPKYVALSYTWASSYPDNEKLPVSLSDSRSPGTSPNRLRIERKERRSNSVDQPTTEHLSLPKRSSPPDTTNTCNGIMLNGRPFPIGHNLHLAMLHLRSPTHYINIWADAICINQVDYEERNSQVSLMAFIYTRAIKVIAWLGTKYYPPMTSLIRSMALDWKAGRTQHLAASLAGKDTMRSSQRPDIRTLGRIFSSTYWKRLWIVQEMCLPRILVLMYGTEIWTFEDFKQYAYVFCNQNEPRVLFETRDKRHTDIMRLESLVERFAKSDCAELRDRIYGLLGCANDVRPVAGRTGRPDPLRTHIDALSSGQATSIQPRRGMGSLGVDYHCSFYDIWISVVGFVYFKARNSERNTSFTTVAKEIERANREKQKVNPEVEERQFSIVRTASVLQDALGQKVEEELTSDKTILAKQEYPVIAAMGYIAGYIVHLGPDYKSLVGSSSAVLDWNDCWVDHYPTEADLQRLRTVNEDYTARMLDYTQAELARIRNIYNCHVSAQLLIGPGVTSNIPRPHPIKVCENLQASMGGENQALRICLGTGYTLGLVPSAAKVGDVIVKFWQCSVAIVLRPFDLATAKTRFMLVGRADIATAFDNPSGATANSEPGLRLWTSNKLPGSITSQHSGALHVHLDLQTLQKITAYITT